MDIYDLMKQVNEWVKEILQDNYAGVYFHGSLRLGSFNPNKFSDDEFTRLQNAYPDKYEEYINRLSAYMETSGKHYANHYATIRKWLDEDSKPKPGNSYDYDYTYDKGECL